MVAEIWLVTREICYNTNVIRETTCGYVIYLVRYAGLVNCLSHFVKIGSIGKID